MKAVCSLVFLLIVQISACSGHAEESRYELLAKVLNPLLAPFAHQTPNPNRSLDAQLSLLAMTGVAPQFIGTRIHLAVEHPDRIYLQGPLLGEPMIICRNKKEVWLAPGAKAEALLQQFAPNPSDSKKKTKLGELELPFSQAQLIFLPALFQVKEYAEEQVSGVSCRILELNLLPEIGRSLGVENWLARLWIGPGYQIAKLEILKPEWRILVGVDKLTFSPKLPESTWQPQPEQGADVLHLKTSRLQPLLDAIGQNLGELPTRDSKEIK